MAWKIEKVRPRVELNRKRRPMLVRYEWSCMFSSCGAAWGTAWRRKQAEMRLIRAQNDLWAP